MGELISLILLPGTLGSHAIGRNTHPRYFTSSDSSMPRPASLWALTSFRSAPHCTEYLPVPGSLSSTPSIRMLKNEGFFDSGSLS
jgi:hypothetical protein